jgi:hypothetical protein
VAAGKPIRTRNLIRFFKKKKKKKLEATKQEPLGREGEV